MTVLNNDGLVGRVLRATRTHRDGAADRRCRLGRRRPGRLAAWRSASSAAAASLGEDSRLDLDLVDDAVVAGRGRHGRHMGQRRTVRRTSPACRSARSTEVYSSPREASQRAVIEPFVDFSALDLVGVVVPAGSGSDRARRSRPTGACDGRPDDTLLARARRLLRASPWPWSSRSAVPAPRLARHGAQPRPAGGRRCGPGRGPHFAAVLGFVAGLRLDLAPAGRPHRRAVGAGPGRRRLPRRPGPPGRAGRPREPWCWTVAAASFVGTSLFALTGVLLARPRDVDRRAARGDPGRRAVGRAAHAVRAAAAAWGCSPGSTRRAAH